MGSAQSAAELRWICWSAAANTVDDGCCHLRSLRTHLAAVSAPPAHCGSAVHSSLPIPHTHTRRITGAGRWRWAAAAHAATSCCEASRAFQTPGLLERAPNGICRLHCELQRETALVPALSVGCKRNSERWLVCCALHMVQEVANEVHVSEKVRDAHFRHSAGLCGCMHTLCCRCAATLTAPTGALLPALNRAATRVPQKRARER